MRYGLVALCALTMLAGPAFADPGKDESGKGRWGGDRGHREFNFDRVRDRDRDRDWGRRSYNMDRDYRGERRARIPHGHLPPPGKCRTWYPGVPAGHQPPPHRC